MKIALGIEYNGSKFFGWQRQVGYQTVQSVVEEALSKVANEKIHVFCAGRTDTGVHAIGQVIHFNTGTKRADRSWLLGSNANLPYDVSVKWVKEVDEKFHARFSAKARHYRYIIYNNVSRPALFHHKVSWVSCPLDESLMYQSSQCLLGKHDFSSFRGSGCQSNSPFRLITSIKVIRQGDYICIDIIANAFLHHMVRNIVGVLIEVGSGKKPASWVEEVLSVKDRTKGGATASPDGLYLVEVEYPAEFSIPSVNTHWFL